MAEISLREYLEKVDALLKTGKSDEVILHSRQILKHYPKNVAASRYLGQALVRGSDYKEAEPVLRRVLSVYPDDVVAHTGLGDMNDRQGKGDEAIWHIERALEGAPNDGVLVEKWRSLYQRYRKVEDPRFQLTTGAVARQYTRNGLYAQAIETLQTTLEKSPRRVDLRLLLAQTMWNAGMQVEGAETALDVLDVLPYCLEANRLLTLLWLSEGRPSDAQRYLNQIQEVEPYQALQLAQNTAPDDDAFTVPELDYRRIAETQINTDQPDWLTEIDEEAPAPVIADSGEQELNFEDELPQAFLTDLEADEAPVVTRPKTGMTGLLAALDQPQDVADEAMADELPVSDELPDWLLESAPQETSLDAPTSMEAEADPLAWLEASGTELELADEDSDAALDIAAIQEQTGSLDWLEQPADQNAPDLFGDTEFPAAVSEAGVANPLAWLEGSGIELIDEDEMPPTSSLIDEEEMVYSDPANINPLAWLESSGVELVEEDDTLSAMFEAPAQPEAADADPLAWLEAESPELAGEDPQAVLNMDADDSLDWLSKADSPELPASGLLSALPQASAEDDGLDWLRDDAILEEMLDIEDLSDTGGLPVASAETPEEVQPAPDFFADMDRVTDRLPGSAVAVSDNETDGQNTMSEKDELEPQSEDSELSSFEWLNDEPEAEVNAQASASDLDWMTEIPGEQPEWLNEENGEMESAAPTTGGPDWLVEEPGTVTNEFGWLNEAGETPEPSSELPVSSEAFDWLSGGEEDAEPAAEPAAMPDWLSAVAPVTGDTDGEESEAEPAAEMAAMPDWLASVQPSDEEEEPEAEIMAASEALDWSEEEPDAEPIGETPDWLSAIAPVGEAELDEAEPVAEMAAMPDWLASAQPSDEEDEPEAEIMAESEAFDWSEEEPEAEPIGETPEWLSAIAPVGEAEAEADEAEPAAEVAAMPDWLASAQPSDEEEEPEAEIMAESEAFDWSEEEPEAEPIGETPDWLSAIAPVGEDAAEVEPVAEMAAMPDWLASAQPSDEEDEPEAEIMAESEAFDWSEEEPEAEPIGETPDWLSAIAPADEEDAEVESEIEAELNAIEWEAEADEAEPAAELAAMPDWLASAQPSDEEDEIEDAEIIAESEAFDWSEEEPEAEPIGETPDWLSAIAPTAEEDAEIESEVEPDALEWEADDQPEAAQYIPPAAMVAQTRILPDDDFSWTGAEDEAEPEYETDYEANPAHSQFGWLEESDAEDIGEPVASGEPPMFEEEDMDFEEKILASASTPPPADNAPDWLNAMVPGLDLDYQAIEDDRPIESEYIEIPARREQPETAETSQPGNFNWLVDIVDEETGPMRAIQDTPDSARKRSRFTFSRQPAWLRTLMAQRERTDSQSDDDFDLPEWLR